MTLRAGARRQQADATAEKPASRAGRIELVTKRNRRRGGVRASSLIGIMAHPATDPVRPVPAFVRLALLSTATAAGVALIGYLPTARLAGEAGVRAMLAGIGVALLGAWAGCLPTLAYLRRPAREHASGILLGLSLRFALTLGLAIAVWLADEFPRYPLLLWVAIAQMPLLLVDVLGLAALLRQGARSAA